MTIRAKEIPHSDVVRLETEINNLWGELNTANIPHAVRVEMEASLAGCEEEFKSVLGGQTSVQNLENKLREMDRALALAVIKQAANEISKGERSEKTHLAIDMVKRQLDDGKFTPVRARHEIKEIIRHRVE